MLFETHPINNSIDPIESDRQKSADKISLSLLMSPEASVSCALRKNMQGKTCWDNGTAARIETPALSGKRRN
jgi:hypothetical protein